MKWNQQLLSMRCCIIEGKKFSILPNREKGRYMYIYRQSMKVCCSIVTPHGRSRRRFFFLASGHFYSAECYFFLCRYAVPVEDRIEEKGAYMYLCVCVCVHTAYCTYQLTQVYSFIYSLSLSTHFLYPPCIPFSASLITPFPFLTYALPICFSIFHLSYPLFPPPPFVFPLSSPSSDEEDEDSEDEEPEQEIQTVVYFWQGRLASNMGWLHFTLG